MVPRDTIISHITPFGARLDIEIIETPHPVCANRSETNVYESGGSTSYIHFILNQRTVPLHTSFPSCPYRDDGWCELNTFIGILNGTLAESEYNYACNGNYPAVPYGTLSNGVPQ